MAKKEKPESQEKFKTMIGGQALIEGIMMRGPDKDAVVVRGKDGLTVEVTPRKLPKKNSPLKWPLIRGVYNFLGSNVVGVKALMRSADLSPEEGEAESESKLDKWLEKKLGNEKFQKALVSFAVFLGICMSVVLFFLIPMIIGSFFDRWIESSLGINLIEGAIRMVIFILYMYLISRMQEMKRLFSYHGAEHKTIFCYEHGKPLTVENVREESRFHPRCGTSFLLVVVVVSILVNAVVRLDNTFARMGCHLLLLPVVVGISYEINRWCGRHDNWLSAILSAPGKWLQHMTTNEPDDSMIECAIRAMELVIPEEKGSDAW